MEDSKLRCQIWAVAIYLLTTGLRGAGLHQGVPGFGATQKTAWHLAHRIQET